MKNIKIWLLTLAIALSGSGCEKDFDEINTNPNRPEDVPLTNVLISAISQGVRRTHGANMNMTYAGLWVQHYAKIQYIDEDYYDYRPDAFTAHFDALYSGPLADLQSIINKAPNPSNMLAAALTMKAYYFSIITDMWGEVPYTEALNPSLTTTPRYDDQSIIYDGMIRDLRTAADMFNPAGDNLGAGDLIYKGDVAKWKKFANSLRARLLNRAKHKNPSFASELQALLANPNNLIASNSENAYITYPDNTVNSNPIYSNKYNDGRNDHAVSKTLVDLMLSTNDPRLPVYAEKNDQGVYKGQPNGTVEPNPFTSVSAIGRAFRDDPAAPSYLMTYAEVKFIMAEALNNKQHYLDGVMASCQQHGVTPDPAFMATVSTAYDNAPLRSIITQKWLALFGDGCEAYTEYRRTGFPSEVKEVPLSSFPGKGVPTRFAYPTSETGNNKANLEAAIQRQGIDNTGIFSNPMWWKL